MKPGFLRWLISIGAVALGVLHAIRPDLKVDVITVTLFAIAVVPWLASLFKSVELPGGLKVEYRDLVEVKKKAEEVGLVSPGPVKSDEKRHRYAYETVVEQDPNLALAGLRIEIESRLRDIAQSHGIATDRRGITQIARDLQGREILSGGESSVLMDIVPLLNRAAHGAKVDERASQWAADIGPQILASLDAKRGALQVPDLLALWKTSDGTGVFETGEAISRLLVESPTAVLTGFKSDPESFADWLNQLETHTFTLFQSQGELDDDLYTAYYEKLRDRMKGALEPLVASELAPEAKQVLAKLNEVRIRRIW